MRLSFNSLVSIAMLCGSFAIAYVAFAQSETPSFVTSTGTSVATTGTTSVATGTPATVAPRAFPARELSERRQERIVNLAANMSNRMEATEARLQNIVTRLTSRNEKMIAAGSSTESATRYIVEASDQLFQVRTRLENIDTMVNSAVRADNPGRAIRDLQQHYRQIAGDLRVAHQLLVQAVASLQNPEVPPVDGNTEVESEL